MTARKLAISALKAAGVGFGFWAVWFIIADSVPATRTLDLFPGVQLPLPFPVSRLWDILGLALWSVNDVIATAIKTHWGEPFVQVVVGQENWLQAKKENNLTSFILLLTLVVGLFASTVSALGVWLPGMGYGLTYLFTHGKKSLAAISLMCFWSAFGIFGGFLVSFAYYALTAVAYIALIATCYGVAAMVKAVANSWIWRALTEDEYDD